MPRKADEEVPGLAERATERLPRTARPRRYQLELAPDLDAFRFEGEETITLDVVEATSELVLNAHELVVHWARLRPPGAPTGTAAPLEGRPHLDAETQQLHIAFDEPLAPGEGYQLDIRFTGELNDRLHGFYRSTFTDAGGVQHIIASTQFEPADARRAFPCWDEPEYKATFAITLVVPGGLTALSNSAAESDVAMDDGRRRVAFRETMIMSTYLVAFVVGPFELTPPAVVDGVSLRVASVPGKSQLTGFAAEAGTHALYFLSRYFGIPYPADKIDHVAIPDFAFGAMENLGCVTYRENALLVNPAEASQLELQRVAAVVAHETAHMWFGDLVTMKWWNGIWLNEAFATFMELMTDDDFRPEWQVWTAFGPSKAAALATDGLRHTRPVEFPVGSPDEAEAMFDVLTYQKGAAVLRMLEQYLAPDTFRKGIGHYLNTHAHANTETGDLWDALEAVSGEPVRAIMDTWIFQGGYPLITVERGDDAAVISLSQSRFLYDQGHTNERWQVPIRVRASVGGDIQQLPVLLDSDQTTVRFDGPVDWVVVNDGSSGFYRVCYAPPLSRALEDAGIASVCDPAERLALVNDTWALMISGSTELDDWVRLVEALGTEDDPDVWTAMLGAFETLDLAADDEDRAALQRFVRAMAGRAWADLGWHPAAGEADRLGIARGRVLAALGGVGQDQTIRDETAARFERFLTAKDGLTPDLLTPAARVLLAAGSADAWETLLGLYRAGTTPQDKVRYLDALASTSDVSLLARTLDLTLSDDVRTQDAASVVVGVMGNRLGGRLAWEWLDRHWDEVQGRLPAGLVARIFDAVPRLVESDLVEQVHAFMATHEVPHAGPRTEQLLERMDINAAFARRIRGRIAAALRPYNH